MASNMCKIDINLTKQVNDAIITMLLKKGGNEFLMKKDDKASISLRKVISISIILLFIMEIGVMAASSKLNSVKIILSDGYEMDVLTSKTKISEILDENHIILLPNEKVIPGSEEEISDNKTIKITKNASASETQNTEVVSEELSMDKVLSNYNSVTEKIIKEQATIAYETETKDLSTGDGQKEEKVVQNGVDGTKEVTYKVKYLNGQETEKVQIAENVIQNPVNCVKEIRNKKVATVFISTIVNGKNTQMYLCTDCAKELHDNMNPDIKIPFPINDILTNMELSEDTINEWINEFKDMEDKGQIEELVQHENPETLQHNNQHEDITCNFCNTSFDEYKKTGKLGCGKCYSTFRKQLKPIIEGIYGYSEHIGKFPKNEFKDTEIVKTVEQLKEKLNMAIQEEEYEQAAKLRDEILQLEANDM